MPTPITIRTAEAPDAAAIAELERHITTAPRDLGRYFGSLHPSDMSEVVIFVAEMPDGALVGKAEFVQGILPVSRDTGYVLRVVVDPDVRGQGIARRLMEHIFEFARERGVTKLELHVVTTNTPAIRLYEQLGFIEVQQEIYYRKRL